MKIEIKKLSKDFKMPLRMTEGSSCYDIFSAEDKNINPFERQMISSGFSIRLPIGYEAQVRSRSGLALHNGIIVLNAPGTIDSDYKGELKIILINLSKEPFHVQKHMRIAQLAIHRVDYFHFFLKDEEDLNLHQKERKDGGFGSTGLY